MRLEKQKLRERVRPSRRACLVQSEWPGAVPNFHGRLLQSHRDLLAARGLLLRNHERLLPTQLRLHFSRALHERRDQERDVQHFHR